MTYLLTFSCYGTHLHGDARGSWSNGVAQAPHPAFEAAMHELMVQEPYSMGPQARPIVLRSMIELSTKKGWNLLAAHVRTTHVHLVLDCDAPIDRVIASFKGSATTALCRSEDNSTRRRWSKGGSRRALPTSAAITAAVGYVLRGQGDPMSVYPDPTACL